ncbi:Sec-independent protein translocase protein tatA/E-like protein [Desulfotomaculum nigrificans CO-1-SRB]|uniref:Sec-independent protein translocase protein TatA n=1 Tax=Desulfotomaculum nigrificans (strain DSM 14880 / VKM B-2319 / CO-1-SRB) TaxID=868595 RepID=F6B9K4_DESCC|nr:twin-arginine translocase TatA/TatE family subunit [Desulfotomaculum nigrificans]AEF94900.1 Sec-independent protein translocase protein tatA/E-like protein [Desulfotomaculum nigrificans CO-1-SRB]
MIERGVDTFFEGILQPTHLFLILIVVLIIFGPGKLPEVGKAMGRTVSEFRKATSANFEQQEEKKEQLSPAKEESGDKK